MKLQTRFRVDEVLRAISPALLSVLLCSPAAFASKVSDGDGPNQAKPPVIAPLPNLPAPADVAKPPADAEKGSDGLVTKVLQKGTGTVHPTEADIVEVNYVGWQQRDGYLFDTSAKRNSSVKFPLKFLIKGWRIGMQLMVAGEKRRMWIPGAIAYGMEPRAPGKAYGDLCFDVELVSIIAAPPEAKADEKPAPKGKKSPAKGAAK
jgi:peptidylprolyl isomerase